VQVPHVHRDVPSTVFESLSAAMHVHYQHGVLLSPSSSSPSASSVSSSTRCGLASISPALVDCLQRLSRVRNLVRKRQFEERKAELEQQCKDLQKQINKEKAKASSAPSVSSSASSSTSSFASVSSPSSPLKKSKRDNSARSSPVFSEGDVEMKDASDEKQRSPLASSPSASKPKQRAADSLTSLERKLSRRTSALNSLVKAGWDLAPDPALDLSPLPPDAIPMLENPSEMKCLLFEVSFVLFAQRLFFFSMLSFLLYFPFFI
jgi:hypothetical protein